MSDVNQALSEVDVALKGVLARVQQGELLTIDDMVDLECALAEIRATIGQARDLLAEQAREIREALQAP